MKKSFKIYAVCWAILLALFNVICFVTPNEAAGMSKFGGAFWTGYIFITLAFISQLICAYSAFKADNLQKLFYGIPLITVSYTGLIVMLIVGSLTMAIPNLPNWIGIIVCFIVLVLTAIAVIKASAAGKMVANIDQKVKQQTYFMKAMAVEAQNLANSTENANIKKHCTEVYEAFKFSDPMSTGQVYDIENLIRNEYINFTSAVNSEDLNLTSASANTLLSLISERNNKIKLYK